MSAESVYYTVTYSDRVQEGIEAIARRAAQQGNDDEVRQALRTLDNWLRADPESFGEPFRDHNYMGQTEYLGFAGPLIVRYNIHFPSKTVFVIALVRIARGAGF
jgi:hypothetical protein